MTATSYSKNVTSRGHVTYCPTRRLVLTCAARKIHENYMHTKNYWSTVFCYGTSGVLL